MAAKEKATSKQSRKVAPDAPKGDRFNWPFGLYNLSIILFGVIVLLLGYYLMAQGPHDSFSSLTLSPLLLMFGYLVVFPVGILYRKKGAQKQETAQEL